MSAFISTILSIDLTVTLRKPPGFTGLLSPPFLKYSGCHLHAGGPFARVPITPEEFERLRAIYYAAMELPETERAAFVEANTPGQESVRAEMMALLNGQAPAS